MLPPFRYYCPKTTGFRAAVNNRPGVSSTLSFHLLFLQGLIDVEKEVSKLQKVKGELEKQKDKLMEKMAKGDYKEKVPIKVQEADAEKVTKQDHLLFTLQY